MLLIALVQGLLLLVLHRAIELDAWPSQSPQWLLTFYSLVLSTPLMLLLALEQNNIKPLLRWILPFSLLLAGMAFYTGSQATIAERFELHQVLPVFVITVMVAVFKVLMYAQNSSQNKTLSYHLLFRFSWRNFLSLALSGLFTLCVWAVLMLWAQLFVVIGIDFFKTLFESKWFYYPVLNLAFGLGVIIFRSQEHIIDTLTRIQQALMKFLLLILIFVSLLFLMALPFTGLTLLWNTGSGSILILVMQGLILFFINAVYQDEPECRPYPLLVHRFIYLGIALLPIYSIIVYYGLHLRIEQYGWTIARAWGVVLWALLALFSIGYLWGIVRRRDNWLVQLSWVNVRMGGLVLALMILLNSPLLDFRKITVSSQLHRLEQTQLTLDELDLAYFRQELAYPGYLALQNIKQNHQDNAELQRKIENLYLPAAQTKAMTEAQFFAKLARHNVSTLPAGLSEAIYAFASQDVWRLNRLQQGWLIAVDLDQDGTNDYLLVQVFQQSNLLSLFYKDDGNWLNLPVNGNIKIEQQQLTDLSNSISELKIVEPRWKILQLGDLQLAPRTER